VLRISILACLILGSCSETKVSYELLVLDAVSSTDTLAEQVILPYRDTLIAKMSEVVAVADGDMERGRPDSPLGSLIADLILEEARSEMAQGGPLADICILNIGGLRVDLSAGDITLGEVFELMPFENSICLVKLGPQAMKAMLAYLVEVGGQPISGMLLTVQDSMVAECLINGKPVEERDYWVATSDYLVDGGDRMHFFKDHLQRIDLGLKIRDAIIRNFQMKGKRGVNLVAPIDERIIYKS
jgi:2',3'-cyclic-nucleotide 2'-phosphodiesterase (5'-nucleotidase family)